MGILSRMKKGHQVTNRKHLGPQENEDGREVYELGLDAQAYMFEPRRRPIAEGERPPVGDDKNRLETMNWYVLVYLYFMTSLTLFLWEAPGPVKSLRVLLTNCIPLFRWLACLVLLGKP